EFHVGIGTAAASLRDAAFSPCDPKNRRTKEARRRLAHAVQTLHCPAARSPVLSPASPVRRMIMKEKLAVLICAILISTLAQALTLPRAGDGKLTPEEKAKAIKMLLDSQTEFLSYVEKLTDAQWNARPIPFKWTVGETAEHIALSEG